jgi:hypothetical protein
MPDPSRPALSPNAGSRCPRDRPLRPSRRDEAPEPTAAISVTALAGTGWRVDAWHVQRVLLPGSLGAQRHVVCAALRPSLSDAPNSSSRCTAASMSDPAKEPFIPVVISNHQLPLADAKDTPRRVDRRSNIGLQRCPESFLARKYLIDRSGRSMQLPSGHKSDDGAWPTLPFITGTPDPRTEMTGTVS